MKRFLWIWLPALAQMAVIFAFSSLSHPDIPFGVSDHSGHFAGYAILGALVLRGFASGRWAGVRTSAAWRSLLFSSAYGVTDEFHQRVVPGRTPALDDWMADTLGAAAAIILAVLVGWMGLAPGSEKREV